MTDGGSATPTSPGGQEDTEVGQTGLAETKRTPFWRWLLSPLVIVVWLVVGLPLGGFQSKLTEIQENDNAQFLPASSESTRVVDLEKKFDEQDVTPAIVIYARDSGITAQDRAVIADDIDQFADIDGVVGDIPKPIPSDDGKAMQVYVPLDGEDGFLIADHVKEMRSIIDDDKSGMTVYVTGQGGLFADFGEAFSDIDGMLLLVAGIVVASILMIVYRSPILPIVVLICVGLALGLASALIYALASNDILDLNGQSQGILLVLVFGATTDYALLLISRYREELHQHPVPKDAIRAALKASAAPIIASGGTVIAGLMCMLFSDLNSNKSLGPVAAFGIISALLAALTFLPATLALLRRFAFWPFKPVYGDSHIRSKGLWGRVSEFVGRHSRITWATTALVLLFAALFVPQLDTSGLPQDKAFTTTPDSVKGQRLLSAHFPSGLGSPAIIIGNADRITELEAAARGVDGVAEVAPEPATGSDPADPNAEPKVADGLVLLNAVLADSADSDAAMDTVERLRTVIHDVPGADGQVGGFTATTVDTLETSERDLRTIIPIVLAVIFVILALLLRAVIAPILLIATVLLSFGATLGVSALVFPHLFDFDSTDPAVPLFGFVFLVALGIDYNIFLMTRVREESRRLGTRAGTLYGLRVTGGVITSAGIVLAATFGALSVLPVVFAVELAFIVAFGVLLDTLVVRSLLVPAATIEIGRRVWWPGKLWRGQD